MYPLNSLFVYSRHGWMKVRPVCETAVTKYYSGTQVVTRVIKFQI